MCCMGLVFRIAEFFRVAIVVEYKMNLKQNYEQNWELTWKQRIIQKVFPQLLKKLTKGVLSSDFTRLSKLQNIRDASMSVHVIYTSDMNRL